MAAAYQAVLDTGKVCFLVAFPCQIHKTLLRHEQLPGRQGEEVGKKLDLLYSALKAKALSQKATDHLEAIASGRRQQQWFTSAKTLNFKHFWPVSRSVHSQLTSIWLSSVPARLPHGPSPSRK